MTDICPRCGRDLAKIPVHYQDFMHLDQNGVWCCRLEDLYGIEGAKEIRDSLDSICARLNERLTKALEAVVAGADDFGVDNPSSV